MALTDYLESNRERHLDELFAFLHIPSVSTDPDRTEDVAQAAAFVADALRRAGLEAEVHPTDGHGVVVGRSPEVPGAPTVLVYGHYDVQPAEPLELWNTPPFEATVIDGDILARGASDDKGQVYAHIKGVEALTQVDGALPLNVLFVVEGEEEIGSPNLRPFLERNAAALAADVVVISDGAMMAPDTPTLTYGLKGLAYLEVHVRGAGRDLHSGAYGGGVPNAINALAAMIAGLKDGDGRVTVPGFYDAVTALDDEERARMAAAPFDEAAFRADAGVSATPGEAGYSLIERLWARPTLDCNGIWGGFQGDGAKTVIPATAAAKLSCRLVPGQDPDDITEKVAHALEALAPEGIEVEVKRLHGGRPAATPIDAASVRAAAEALRASFGREPVFARTGGTIPVVADFQELLGSEVVLVGLGLEDDRAHAPNEKFAVRDYLRGIHTSALLFRALARGAA
jgi:acetylornithine deacetylase/succinyl-diaminopimelate desuccinylase-like protein